MGASGTSINYVVTVTDVNDNAPTYASADSTPSIAENAVAIESISIADVDTTGECLYNCSLSGTDSADFLALWWGTVSLAFASAPDFENHGDDDGDGDYAVTLTVNDGS